MARPLPHTPNFEFFQKEAKDVLTWHRNRDPRALPMPCNHPDFENLTPEEFFARPLKLTQAQHMLARAYAFNSWPQLKRWVLETQNPWRPRWVAALMAQDMTAVRELIDLDRRLVNGLYLELDDPFRGNQFPTRSLTYATSGPWPQTKQCEELYRDYKPNLELVQLLLDAGADPKGWASHGRPLSWIRDREAAQLLIAHGADLDDWEEGTPLNFSCWRGRPEDMRMLLGLGANPHLANPENGESYLHVACGTPGAGATACARLLLEAGVNPDSICHNDAALSSHQVVKLLPGTPLMGETALHRAALNGDEPRIELLLRFGADARKITATGETPLDWARRAGRKGALLELLK